jgi:hypothetical protein
LKIEERRNCWMDSVTLRCPSCHSGFQVLEDEWNCDHECPSCGFSEKEEIYGTDYLGSEIVEGDDIVLDGDKVILQINLEEYLEEVYGFKFQTAN